MEGKQAFRFTSPMLNREDPLVLRECPTGKVLRETPYVYKMICLHGEIESGALSSLSVSPWAQSALQIVGSEKSRLREAEQEQRRGRIDSRRGMAARNG